MRRPEESLQADPSRRWERGFEKGLARIRKELHPRRVRAFGVCLAPRAQGRDFVEVLAVGEFLKRLWSGEIIESAGFP